MESAHADEPPPKDEGSKVELVYSGKTLEELRTRFRDEKFTSKKLAAVMQPMALEYETIVLGVRADHKLRITSIKVSATKTDAFPPKGMVIESLNEKDEDFKTFIRVVSPDFEKALKSK